MGEAVYVLTYMKLKNYLALKFRLLKGFSSDFKTIAIALSMTFKVWHADSIQRNHQLCSAGHKRSWHVHERVLHRCLTRYNAIEGEITKMSAMMMFLGMGYFCLCEDGVESESE